MAYNEPRRYFTLSSSNHPSSSSTVALPPTPPMAEGNGQQPQPQQQHVSPTLGGGGGVPDHPPPSASDAAAAQQAHAQGHHGQQQARQQLQQQGGNPDLRLLQLQHGAGNGVGAMGGTQQQAGGTNANLAASGMNLFGGQALNLGAGGGGGLQAQQQQQLGVAGLLAGAGGGAGGLNQSSLNQLVAGFNQHNQLAAAAAGQQAAAQQAAQHQAQQQQGQLGLHGQAGTAVDLDQLMATIQAQQQAQQRTVVQAALARAFPGGAAGPGAGNGAGNGLGGLAGGLGGYHGGGFGGAGNGTGLQQQQQLLLSQLQQQGGGSAGGGIDLLGSGGQLGGQQAQQARQLSNEQLLAQLGGQKTTGLPGREGAGLKSDGGNGASALSQGQQLPRGIGAAVNVSDLKFPGMLAGAAQQQQQQQAAGVASVGTPQPVASAKQPQQPGAAPSSSGQQQLLSAAPQAYNFLPMLAAAAQEQQRSIQDTIAGRASAAAGGTAPRTASRAATVVPCRARGMPVDHNFKTAYFVVPEGIEHGDELLCSYPACRAAGCKFRYCLYCKVPVAKRNFRNRHRHGVPGGDGVEELSDSETEDEATRAGDRTDPTGFLTAGTACRTVDGSEYTGSEPREHLIVLPGTEPANPEKKRRRRRSGRVKIPCRARGMPMAHNARTAYFVVPPSIQHGDELMCSFPACRSAGCKFRWCAVCKVPVAKRNFRNRHKHGNFGQKGGGGPSSPGTAAGGAAAPAAPEAEGGAAGGDDLKSPPAAGPADAPPGPAGPAEADAKMPAHPRDGANPEDLAAASAPAVPADGSAAAGADGGIVSVSTGQDPSRVREWVSLMESRPDPGDGEAMARWMASLVSATGGGAARRQPQQQPAAVPPAGEDGPEAKRPRTGDGEDGGAGL
mmetsp:Transcript_2731/g.6288  ORF Transcript_2731/g.6288 Transcript_2731/m.6288 type:complete len:894 (-) Transcript_2731:257-2938(-)